MTINPGTVVFHEFFGFGKFIRYESKIGTYYGFAIVKFNDYPGESIISPKKLTEIDDVRKTDACSISNNQKEVRK